MTVTGQAPLIDTSNASTGGVLSRETLESLPAPGRNAFLIGITVPTVMPVGDPQFNRQQDQTNASRVSLGGGGIRANNYLLDGVPISELRGRAVLNPTIEAVEEVKVQIHTYDAEMGRTGGGVFNVTARSGTNDYHGSGFYQTRPVWGQSENFFNTVAGVTKEESGLADAYYRLYGGGIGGPIIKNRTFFWTAMEGYRSGTTRGQQEIWPTANQRNGDFSHSTSGGIPIVLFNPYCRSGVASARCPATGTGSIATGGLFTNAHHPAHASGGQPDRPQHPEDVADRNDQRPHAAERGRQHQRERHRVRRRPALMWTFKAEHKFNDKSSLSGLYIYNKTDEPGSTIMKPDKLFMADQDQWFGPLRRRPHVLVLNSTNVLNNTTVLSVRYGFSTWQDSCDAQPFSPGLQTLGFSPTYVNALGPGGSTTFPSLTVRQYRRRRRLGPRARPLEGPVRDQRRADQAPGQPQLQGRRRRAPARRRAGHGNGARRHLLVQQSLHQQERHGRQRAREPAARPARHRIGAARSGELRVVHEVLGRIFPGRLARELEVHAELRPAPRARRRPARDQQPADGRLRSERGQSRSTRWCRRPARCSPERR